MEILVKLAGLHYLQHMQELCFYFQNNFLLQLLCSDVNCPSKYDNNSVEKELTKGKHRVEVKYKDTNENESKIYTFEVEAT